MKTHIDVWDANFSCVKNMFTFRTLHWFTEKKDCKCLGEPVVDFNRQEEIHFIFDPNPTNCLK